MKKVIHLFPIMALSTLLAACGSGGGKGGEASAKSTPKTPPVVTQQQPEVLKPVAVQAQPQPQPEAAQPVEIQKQPEVEKPAEVHVQPKAEKPVEQPTPPEPEKIVWSDLGNFPHSKDEVPVIYLIENDGYKFNSDPNFKDKKMGTIALQLGKNRDDKNHYQFYASDNAYYGFYRDSEDMMSVKNRYVYSFNEKAENKSDLSGLTATYNGHFIYSTRSIPQLAMPGKLELRYTNGEAEGEIISHLYGDKLFDVKSLDNKARSLELKPVREMLDNSFEELSTKDRRDSVEIDVHFINGADGTENKTLVGKGGNEKYWGVLGAELQ